MPASPKRGRRHSLGGLDRTLLHRRLLLLAASAFAPVVFRRELPAERPAPRGFWCPLSAGTILPSIGIGNDEFAHAGDAAWGADSGGKHEPVSDIDTASMASLTGFEFG
jgi:hypothetical protein